MTYQPVEKDYFALALDPIHVGTGGYRLGEVDLTILREPGTNLPKIPGSSLEGTARAYTAMSTGRYQREDDNSCAGKGGDDGSKHCGEIDCPVCVTYGFSKGNENRSFQGLAQFHDAHILFFPVHSLAGPVWVSTPEKLLAARLAFTGMEPSGENLSICAALAGSTRRGGLNLGWLFLEAQHNNLNLTKSPAWLPAPLQDRWVMVPDALFPLVVNANLEVRTSVSIDPDTGAAEDKALFTYEAVPRGTLFQFSVVYLNPQHYTFPAWDKDAKQISPTSFPKLTDTPWLNKQVTSGLRLMKYLGIGGMTTRGFGRFDVLNLPKVNGDKEVPQ